MDYWGIINGLLEVYYNISLAGYQWITEGVLSALLKDY